MVGAESVIGRFRFRCLRTVSEAYLLEFGHDKAANREEDCRLSGISALV